MDRHIASQRFGLAVTLVVLSILSACATQPQSHAFDPPGFWLGILHGFTILFSLIGSIFTEYRIYAFPNSGGGYDFGYFLGLCMFIGGAAEGR